MTNMLALLSACLVLEQYLEWAGFQATATPYFVEVEFDPRPGDGALRIRRAITRGAAR